MPRPNNIALGVVLLCFVFQSIAHLYAQDLALPAPDTTAPKIEHAPITEEMPSGQPLPIAVVVTDETEVKAVTLFYRVKGTENFQRRPMARQGSTNEYVADVPADDTRVPGIEYYVQAEDLAGNTMLRGFDFMPLHVAVVKPTPVIEPEPPDDDPNGDKGLSTTQWVLIGLGVAVVGGVVAAFAGGGGGGSSKDETGSVTVSARVPGQAEP